jgi:putative RNA 2'-phosphotransferase
MQSKSDTISKFLSYVLRHKPDSIGLKLSEQGWAEIEELIKCSATHGIFFTNDDLSKIVKNNDKKRFNISADGLSIRAAQGHSLEVNLGLLPQIPPTYLYHGTAQKFVSSILLEGIKPQSRQQVHLSAVEVTAQQVGQRHGKPVVLVVQSSKMYENGMHFYLADNGVWLTDYVAPVFITLQQL